MCGVTADEPAGWTRLLVQDADYVADAPGVPFVASAPAVEFFFHVAACRTSWGAEHDLPAAGSR
ncbi:MAG TPA: hypothetical protein VLK79_12725 [Gaiellales bacterium]|nr:hypothetical protein [Gaiellales bacterium]